MYIMESSSTSCIGSVAIAVSFGSHINWEGRVSITHTLQGGVKEEASSANQHVAGKGNEKYGVVTIPATADDAFDRKVDEQ